MLICVGLTRLTDDFLAQLLQVERLHTALEGKEHELTRMHKEVEALGEANEKKALEFHRQMERMRVEFTHMLQDTLEKLNARLLNPDTLPTGRRAQFLKNKSGGFPPQHSGDPAGEGTDSDPPGRQSAPSVPGTPLGGTRRGSAYGHSRS